MTPVQDGPDRIAREALVAVLARYDGPDATTARRFVDADPAHDFAASFDVSAAELSTIYSRRQTRMEPGSSASTEVDTLLKALVSDLSGTVTLVVVGSGQGSLGIVLSHDAADVLAVLSGSGRARLAAVDQHHRRHLGRLEGIRSFSARPDGVDLELDLLVFEPDPDGYHPIATRGLSRHLLALGAEGSARMELLMIVPAEAAERAQSHLCDVAIDIVRAHRAPARSEVLPRRGELFPGTDKAALMATTPVYQGGGEFFVLDTPDGRVLFPWLLPITAAEADFVRLHGAAAFEDVLDGTDVDVRDPARAPLV